MRSKDAGCHYDTEADFTSLGATYRKYGIVGMHSELAADKAVLKIRPTLLPSFKPVLTFEGFVWQSVLLCKGILTWQYGKQLSPRWNLKLFEKCPITFVMLWGV